MYKLITVLVTIILLPLFSTSQTTMTEGVYNVIGEPVRNTSVKYENYKDVEIEMYPENDSLRLIFNTESNRRVSADYIIIKYVELSKDRVIVICNSTSTYDKGIDVLIHYEIPEKTILVRTFTHYLHIRGKLKVTGLDYKITKSDYLYNKKL